ncbi:hypothetical protein PWF70_04910 [Gordonia sp. Swx-4]|uniref:hypothetical protein n=1 Tax=Gordonia sp. Swx-4 TaxID=3029399 RepID=UPI002572436F|nr:hypothetical protein [Gordonia sp. Swx-4]WJG14365.1 hypothetical protein PWF70_04910 [Gordonia sp. Swx-4]
MPAESGLLVENGLHRFPERHHEEHRNDDDPEHRAEADQEGGNGVREGREDDRGARAGQRQMRQDEPRRGGDRADRRDDGHDGQHQGRGQGIGEDQRRAADAGDSETAEDRELRVGQPATQSGDGEDQGDERPDGHQENHLAGLDGVGCEQSDEGQGQYATGADQRCHGARVVAPHHIPDQGHTPGPLSVALTAHAVTDTPNMGFAKTKS